MVERTQARSVYLALTLFVLAVATAFAQLSLIVEPGCIECCPLEGLRPCPCYTAVVVGQGWEPDERLVLILRGPGPAGPFGTGFFSADDTGRLEAHLIFLCENPWLAEEGGTSQLSDGYWWIHPDWKPQDYGLWKLEVRGDSGSVAANFLFAKDCAAAEFVPEPGTVMLLATGMAGAVAYATLRLRRRGR
jgi:hypothetical protein